MEKQYTDKYKPGKIIRCKGINGVIVYPRKRNKISIAWQGLNDIDDYGTEWLEKNCQLDDDIKRGIYQEFYKCQF